MAYGGRAYDDDEPWWKEENHTQSTVQPTDDFDSPPPQPTRLNQNGNKQSTFHGSSHGGSYGVYNKYGCSAYDDHNDVYSQPTNTSQKQSSKRLLDPYDAIRAKSKINPGPKNTYSNPQFKDSNHNHTKQPTHSKTKSLSFATKPITSTQSQPYNNGKSLFKKPKPTQSVSAKNVRKNASYSRSNFGNANVSKSTNVPAGISNPAYRRTQLRNKYKNGTNPRRAPRQRPEMHTIEQQQEYKEQLREDTKSHLDQALSTAYQTEDLAADTSEKLYYQRSYVLNYCISALINTVFVM